LATELDICNLALQKLGAKAISSLTEDTRNGRAMALAYPIARDAELSDNPWSFAIERVQLAADATAPAFGKGYSYPLPADFLMLAPPDATDNYNDRDWEIEGNKIFTDYSAPLNVRYVKRPEVGMFTSLFVEALSSRLARDTAEAITQSNSKKADAQAMYDKDLAKAKRRNAIQKPPAEPYLDTFLTVRN
jgi:hypothetical protein